MLRRAAPLLALLVVLLLVVACESEPPSVLYTDYLEEEIPPCTPVEDSSVDPCEPYTYPVCAGCTMLEMNP